MPVVNILLIAESTESKKHKENTEIFYFPGVLCVNLCGLSG